MTNEDWVVDNLRHRIVDPYLDYNVNLYPYPFKAMTFHQAADWNAQLIASRYPKLYVGFSGGADSDFVVHCLQRNGIKFTPIIVETSGNSEELSYAYRTIDKLKLDPVILKMTDQQYLTYYFEKVIKQIHGYGIYAVPGILACEYARDNGGVLIIGEHLIDEHDGMMRPGSNEWDFYNEFFVGKEYNVPFFLYSIELTSIMLKLSTQYRSSVAFKTETYGLTERPMMTYVFDEKFNMVAQRAARTRFRKANPNCNFGSTEKLLESWNKFIQT